MEARVYNYTLLFTCGFSISFFLQKYLFDWHPVRYQCYGEDRLGEFFLHRCCFRMVFVFLYCMLVLRFFFFCFFATSEMDAIKWFTFCVQTFASAYVYRFVV
ncbi:hypothetical protein FPQ18DRAFT_157953 [Pyronema domesticum]|nr:hypothetical protein FPQ18DRAFT_157953 [Pyronema domesticum]